jgi:uncharacterized membrane protein
MLAYHVWHTKENNGKLVCVIGKDCNTVIHSEHAKTLGVENTILGMLYYVFVIAVSLAVFLFPSILTISFFSIVFLIVAGAAALFSVYLTGVQLFVLKELCEYCLASTAMVIVIFVILVI